MEFKRRFLPLYLAKSRSQTLRRCGNECRRRWDREIQEYWYLNISIGLICSRILWNRKNISIYTSYGRNRPIVLINRFDGTVHREPFQTCRSRTIRDEALGWNPLRCVIKRIRSPSLDRDLTIRMHLARLNHSRYNSLFTPCVFDGSGGPRVHAIHARWSVLRLIQRLAFSHVTCT